jgi:outer membrane lipoprotein
MKRVYLAYILLLLVVASLVACAPVIRKDLMDVGIRNVPLSEVKQNPEFYRGKLFILGGIIAGAKVTEEGSLVEALHVPVDSRGYLTEGADGRYLALFPRESGMLDPLIYRKGKRITVAAEFVEIREGKLDESEYAFPLFEIREIYLWEDRAYYYPPPYYYYPYYWWDYPYPWRGGPYWRYGPFWW